MSKSNTVAKPSFARSTSSMAPVNKAVELFATHATDKALGKNNPAIQPSFENFLQRSKLDDERFRNVTTSLEAADKSIEQIMRGAGFSDTDWENLTSAQREAGAYAYMAFANPTGYARKAYAFEHAQTDTSNAALPVIAVDTTSNPALGYTTKAHAALEAFDDREVKAHVPMSVVYNVQAARQDPFGELFYPTLVVTPDQNGVDVLVKRVMVFNEWRHDTSGKAIDIDSLRVNLVKAHIDATVLSSDVTLATPVFYTGNAENNSHFAPTADIAPRQVEVRNKETILTSPLKPFMDHNLLSLSQTPAMVAAGLQDQTASLDHRITVEKLYIKVTEATGSTSAFLPIDTTRLPRNAYQKGPEGLDKELLLNFITKNLVVTGLNKDTAGAPTGSPSLVYLRDPLREDLIIHLGVDIGGSANVEVGTVKFNPSPIYIHKVYEKQPDGKKIEVTDTAVINALKAELTFEFGYADIGARRSNIDRRDKGLLVTNVEHVERFAVPLLSPITCQTPRTSTGTGGDVTAPINATRIRNSNNAVTKLFQYADQLLAAGINEYPSDIIPDIEGPGRHMVGAYYFRDTVDVTTLVNSIKSQDRRADVKAALVNMITSRVADCIQKTGYLPVLQASNGYTNEMPLVAIGTDAYINTFLMIDGDTRTLGPGLECQIEVSPDRRMYGKIAVALVRRGITGADPLNFGNMVWMPELVTELDMTRNNAAVHETMVQPRVLHLNTCPILIIFDIENLDQAVSTRVNVPFENV
jgi:hypothetical protein